MIRKIYYASDLKYIPNSGGRLTITLTGFFNDGETQSAVIFNKVFSESGNFTVSSMTKSGYFDTVIVLDVKNLNSITWESNEDKTNQQLRIFYEFVDITGSFSIESFAIPFVGDYNYCLEKFAQSQTGSRVNGVSKVKFYSYEVLSTNDTIKHAINSIVFNNLPSGISANIVTSKRDALLKVDTYELTLTVNGDISSYSGVIYDSVEKVYKIPIIIRQVGIVFNPRNNNFDENKARQATYLVQFNPV